MPVTQKLGNGKLLTRTVSDEKQSDVCWNRGEGGLMELIKLVDGSYGIKRKEFTKNIVSAPEDVDSPTEAV